MGTIENINCMDLTEAEDIKKKWQEYTEKLHKKHLHELSSVQFCCSVMSGFCNAKNINTPGLPVHHQLPEFTQTHVHRVGGAIQPSHLLLPLLLLPPTPPSIRISSNESTLHMRWPKYWSFSLSVSPSNEHPGLVYFRMDWLDLLAVKGTCKGLFSTTVQNHQFFGTQLSSRSNSYIHT